MADKDEKESMILEATSAIKSKEAIVACVPEDGCDVSISLGAETLQQIEKLERYAILAGHRIGEFRVG
ncbi:hypothetical protein [Altererythrobacter sp. MF3-039]|uniref:hypothetical protein n=1 Tax=Altererythrobacter sp. MF3-039 TaxID=3252901 RepID=UPI00390CBE18